MQTVWNQNVRSDLDPNCLIQFTARKGVRLFREKEMLMILLKNFSKKLVLKKKTDSKKSMRNYRGGKEFMKFG